MSGGTFPGRFFRFRGRAGRTEFWGAMAVILGVSAGLLLLANAVGIWGALAAATWGLAAAVPLLSVTARRLHDYDLSGWWMVLALVPVTGVFFVLWVALLKGTEGPNRFGPKPGAGAMA